MNAVKAWTLATLFFMAIGSIGVAKPQKKSTESSQETPEAILAAAKKATETRAWRVNARIEADKQMNISGIVAVNDFDLTIETLDGATRQITLGDKSWITEDGGKNWKNADVNDRRFYYLVHTPIKFSADQQIPPHEKVPPGKGETEDLLHVRFKVAEKIHYEGDRPNWWIALESGRPTVIRRYLGPGVFEGGYVTTDATYTEIGDQPAVVAPPGNPHALAAEPGPGNLLMAAMKKMNEGVWEVNGTASYSMSIKLHGLISGNDFDITMEPENGDVVRRLIVVKDRAWASSDAGKSFHPGTPNDRLVYNLTHTPIMSGRMAPPFEKIATEQRNGKNSLHIKLKVAEKNVDPKELPQYWLVLDKQGQVQYIGHAEMPMLSQDSNVIHCSFDYAPSKQKIAPPLLGPPVDDRAHGFKEIEQHKFDWSGKIVRVEVDPKILQSEQIGDGIYRAILKDTGTPEHYGVVEFPFDSLVKLGFLKKTVDGTRPWDQLEKMGALGRTEGAPVSFYVEVIPIGEKPAARTIVVGAKLSREPDGAATYSW
jgi:hypothetical protein